MDQQTSMIVGLVLIGLGLLDPVLGALVVAPRVPERSRRMAVVIAFVLSGVVMVTLGVAFLTRLIG